MFIEEGAGGRDAVVADTEDVQWAPCACGKELTDLFGQTLTSKLLSAVDTTPYVGDPGSVCRNSLKLIAGMNGAMELGLGVCGSEMDVLVILNAVGKFWTIQVERDELDTIIDVAHGLLARCHETDCDKVNGFTDKLSNWLGEHLKEDRQDEHAPLWMANARQKTLTALLGKSLSLKMLKVTNTPPNGNDPVTNIAHCLMLIDGIAYDTRLGLGCDSKAEGIFAIIANTHSYWTLMIGRVEFDIIVAALRALCDLYIGSEEEDKAELLIQNFNNWIETYAM